MAALGLQTRCKQPIGRNHRQVRPICNRHHDGFAGEIPVVLHEVQGKNPFVLRGSLHLNGRWLRYFGGISLILITMTENANGLIPPTRNERVQ